MNPHLNSEQLESALAGHAWPEAAAHLEGCVRCTEELTQMSSLFTGLRESASLTAERVRYAVPNSALLPAPSRRDGGMAWSLAAAALFVGVLSPVLMHRHAEQPAVTAAPSVVAEMTDEALLSGVQNDLSSSVPESLLPLAATSSTTQASTAVSQRKTQ